MVHPFSASCPLQRIINPLIFLSHNLPSSAQNVFPFGVWWGRLLFVYFIIKLHIICSGLMGCGIYFFSHVRSVCLWLKTTWGSVQLWGNWIIRKMPVQYFSLLDNIYILYLSICLCKWVYVAGKLAHPLPQLTALIRKQKHFSVTFMVLARVSRHWVSGFWFCFWLGFFSFDLHFPLENSAHMLVHVHFPSPVNHICTYIYMIRSCISFSVWVSVAFIFILSMKCLFCFCFAPKLFNAFVLVFIKTLPAGSRARRISKYQRLTSTVAYCLGFWWENYVFIKDYFEKFYFPFAVQLDFNYFFVKYLSNNKNNNLLDFRF